MATKHKKKRGKKHIPGYLIGLLVMGVLFNATILPALIWLYYGQTAEAGLLEQVPYHIDTSQAKEQRLCVVSGAEERTIRIPVTGTAVMEEEIAAKRLRLTVDAGVLQDTGQLTVTADTACLAFAALYRAGGELVFEFTLSDEMRASLTQTEEGQLLTLQPLTDPEGIVILLDVRDGERTVSGNVVSAGVSADEGAVGNGMQTNEKTYAAKVAELICEELSTTEGPAPIVYVIGNESEALTDADYEAFITQCAPDVVLKIREGAEENGYAVCNPRYFLPGLDSVVLAETVLKEMIAATGETTDGVKEAEVSDCLRSYEIPAAEVVLGSTAGKSAETQTSYAEAAARGIALGLTEAISMREEQR